MSKLIFDPGVFTFAKPTIDWVGLTDWLEYNDYTAKTEPRLFALIGDMQTGEVSVADGLSELCARFCYRAFKAGRPTGEHLANILESGHGSVLAHVSITFAIQGVSRTLTHELVRHHVGVNPSQESQRYVDANDINFVVPPLLAWAWDKADMMEEGASEWLFCQLEQVERYKWEQRFLKETLERINPFDDGEKLKKRINEAARCHLPGCAETRLTWTMNLRAARDILGNPAKRGGEGADLEIRRLALHLLDRCQKVAPVVFQDFEVVEMPVVYGIKSKWGGV